jgi:ABC-type glycerol-3-phosphate transport system permease component
MTTIALLALISFPFYWTLVTTLKPPSEQFERVPRLIPKTWTLSNYSWLLAQKDFLRALLNSAIVSLATALVATTLNSFAGYSLARYRYRGKAAIIAYVLSSQMMPGTLTIVPLFVIFARLKLVNTFPGLILGFCTFSVPWSLLILRGFFDSIPHELEEAALIDGCTRLGAFVRVVLPLASPGIAATALFTFVGVWNDLLFAMILSRDLTTKTAAVALSEMINQQYSSTNWGGMIAEGMAMTLPIAIIFSFLQKYLVQGLTAGALKG